MPRRLSKILMCFAPGLFAALVAYGNVIDDAHYAFVRHVMATDTTADSVLKHRAVTSPTAWRAVYGAIVAAGALWRARGAPAQTDMEPG